jgi:hypothetical protein
MARNVRTNGAASDYYADQGIAALREACGLPALKPGTVVCRICEEKFESPDRVNTRICKGCKAGSNWKGSQESDHIYPNVRTPPEQTVKPGKKGPGVLVGRGRIIQSAMKKKARTKEQKLFGNAPLSKKRTRV